MLLCDGESSLSIDLDERNVGVRFGKGVEPGLNHFTGSTGLGGEERDRHG